MVEYTRITLDRVFHALADPTRRDLLDALSAGEQSVSALVLPYTGRLSFAAVSKHIKILEEAGLVSRAIRGRQHVIRMEASGLKSATDWCQRYAAFWSERMDALEALLDEEQTE